MGLVKDNHTQVNNEFIDYYMNKLSDSSVKVFLVITRKTKGWHKDSDAISISQIQKAAGLSNRVVIKSIKELEYWDLITVEKTHGKVSTYTLNYENCTSQPMTKSHTTYDEKSQVKGKTYDEKSHTKESIKKTFTKDIYSQLFNFWNSQTALQKHNNLNTFTKNFTIARIEYISTEYSIFEIEKAISNYNEIISDDKYFFNYKWPLWEFLNRGLHKFVDSATPHINFLKKESAQKSYQQELDELYGGDHV